MNILRTKTEAPSEKVSQHSIAEDHQRQALFQNAIQFWVSWVSWVSLAGTWIAFSLGWAPML